jgi:hypothetical protein
MNSRRLIAPPRLSTTHRRGQFGRPEAGLLRVLAVLEFRARGQALREHPCRVRRCSRYIADQVPSRNLAPPNGTIGRTKLQAWLNFISSEMHKGGFSPLFYRGMPEEAQNIFRARLTARFTHLDLTAKLFVPAGHRDHRRCGDLLPPAQPNPKSADRMKSFGR